MKFFLLVFIFISNVWAEEDLILKAKDKKIDLSKEEKEILEIGEISKTRYIVGGILGTYPIGLGIGHAVQGRWSETGWIFTAGELTSAAVIMVGALRCLGDVIEDSSNEKTAKCSSSSNTILIAGFVGYIGFRIWEAIDVWAAPPRINKKYRHLRDYINEKNNEPKKEIIKSSLDISPIISPSKNVGVGLKYTF